MRKPELAPLIAQDYVVVKIDVGLYNKNIRLAAKYGVPISKGIPALAVLSSHGKLLYAQSQGQFQNAHAMPYRDIADFFERWKPKRESEVSCEKLPPTPAPVRRHDAGRFQCRH